MGDASPGGEMGEAARLRKGLFEERPRGGRPGTEPESIKQDC